MRSLGIGAFAMGLLGADSLVAIGLLSVDLRVVRLLDVGAFIVGLLGVGLLVDNGFFDNSLVVGSLLIVGLLAMVLLGRKDGSHANYSLETN